MPWSKLRALAAELDAMAERLRQQADELEAASLRADVKGSTLNRTEMLSAEHRVNLGRAQLKNPRNKLARAAYAAKRPDGTVGYSLFALAKEVGCSNTLLTSAYNGTRAMPRKTAEKIEKLIGYPVSAWPRLS